MPPASQTRTIALVTGASGGIGADLARIFAREGHDLALVARSRDKLEALADEIAATGRPRPLVIALDLAAADGPAAVAAALAQANATAKFLVNNAGFGLSGPAMALDREEQLGMVDLNIRALVELTLRLAPQLVVGKGRILNVASVAAFLPGPGFAVYFASKAFVLSFSQALSQELKPAGVGVTALCPGATATGFQARAGFTTAMAPDAATMTSMKVAEAGFAGMMAGRRVVVPGQLNKFAAGCASFAPRAWLLPVMARFLMKRQFPT